MVCIVDANIILSSLSMLASVIESLLDHHHSHAGHYEIGHTFGKFFLAWWSGTGSDNIYLLTLQVTLYLFQVWVSDSKVYTANIMHNNTYQLSKSSAILEC